jgi:hypothetical protein
MVQHASPSESLSDFIFTETPEYISNTEREFTLKTPIHAVQEPRAGPQNIEYTIGAT